jgi:hypothetical protein
MCFITCTTPRYWQSREKLSGKRDDFNFPFVNFPFICSNVPAVSMQYTYLNWYGIPACATNQDFLDIGLAKLDVDTEPRVPSGQVNVICFALGITTWVTTMEYMCHKWQICCCFHSSILPAYYCGCITRVILRAQIAEKELYTLSKHLSLFRLQCYVVFVLLNL